MKITCNIDSDMNDEGFKEINIESTPNAIGTEEKERKREIVNILKMNNLKDYVYPNYLKKVNESEIPEKDKNKIHQDTSDR
ncbi:hypothetical protein PIROE2DRAFT_11979 [Piromyces sp. E2]|nr:hypothetical protein PIROE2DRAFT_11979 [Piromyces sp. E2]|eukprot:OUM61910.1 hypothetical protein PIROE2DRAFT_11979 [Piromyces sp. E2]